MRELYSMNSIALYIFGFVRDIRYTKYEIRYTIYDIRYYA